MEKIQNPCLWQGATLLKRLHENQILSPVGKIIENLWIYKCFFISSIKTFEQTWSVTQEFLTSTSALCQFLSIPTRWSQGRNVENPVIFSKCRPFLAGQSINQSINQSISKPNSEVFHGIFPNEISSAVTSTKGSDNTDLERWDALSFGDETRRDVGWDGLPRKHFSRKTRGFFLESPKKDPVLGSDFFQNIFED